MEFQISTEALIILTELVESADYPDPVLSLMDSSDSPMSSLSMLRLEVGIYERSQCPSEAIVRIDGISFNLPVHIKSALNGYTLSFEQNKFALVGKQNNFSSFYNFMQHEFGDRNAVSSN